MLIVELGIIQDDRNNCLFFFCYCVVLIVEQIYLIESDLYSLWTKLGKNLLPDIALKFI